MQNFSPNQRYTSKGEPELGLGLNEVRLAYVLNEKDINLAMDCLEQALRVYPNK